MKKDEIYSKALAIAGALLEDVYNTGKLSDRIMACVNHQASGTDGDLTVENKKALVNLAKECRNTNEIAYINFNLPLKEQAIDYNPCILNEQLEKAQLIFDALIPNRVEFVYRPNFNETNFLTLLEELANYYLQPIGANAPVQYGAIFNGRALRYVVASDLYGDSMAYDTVEELEADLRQVFPGTTITERIARDGKHIELVNERGGVVGGREPVKFNP